MQVFQRVARIISDKLSVDIAEIQPQHSFKQDLGADSIDLVELIMEFEREFELSIPDEQAENIKTVQEAVDFIEKSIA